MKVVDSYGNNRIILDNFQFVSVDFLLEMVQNMCAAHDVGYACRTWYFEGDTRSRATRFARSQNMAEAVMMANENDEEIGPRIKKFEKFVQELGSIYIECDKDSLIGDLWKHTTEIRQLISDKTERKLGSLNEQIFEDGKPKKGNKFVSLAEFESKKGIRKTLVAIKSELEGQKSEYISKLNGLEEFLKQCQAQLKETVNPAKSGIHLLANYFIKEHKRMMQGLPIYAWRSKVVNVVKKNRFVVLKGETGSGKSTQLPQYILEGIRSVKKIVVTQPRKVAAISLAHRIAEEQGESIGASVGYHIGMEKKASNTTRLLLMTDRMLLNHCLEHPDLDDISCVIIDEAHERSVNTDLLIGMVKKAAIQRSDLKVIVTSATISTKLFSDYFFGCPVIEVPGRIFPVDEKFEPAPDGVTATSYMKQAAIKALELHYSEEEGDILVFLTSPIEIENAIAEFNRMSNMGKSCEVLPLHGKLQPEDQMKVFNILPEGKRKIVFSTNVAETSVTIPGIKFVIDSGKVKERFYDSKRGLSFLDVKMVSRSSAIQRKGRAGRTGPGTCIRLYSIDDYNALEENNEPEIKKMHLGYAVLSLMALGVNDVMSFDFIESPNRETLQDSMKTLELLGAIEQEDTNQLGNFILTTTGKHMAKLPLEPRSARIVLHGKEKGCLEEAVTMTAVMVYSSSFFIRFGDDAEKKAADEAKLTFANEEGDVFTMLDAFKQWDKENGKKAKNEWCVKNFINAKSMRSVKELISEINNAMMEVSGRRFATRSKKQNENENQFSSKEIRVILTNILISTFYDNIGFFTGHGRIGYFSPKHKELFVIHPSSVFSSLAMDPKFVIFQDVLKTSASYITGITEVSMTALESLCPHRDYQINFEELKKVEIATTSFKNFGSFVTKSVIGKRGQTLRALQNAIKDGSNVPCLIEVNNEKGIVVVYSESFRKEKAKEILEGHIKQQICTLEKEWREENIGEIMTGHRVVISSGLKVEELLQPADSLMVRIMMKSINDESLTNELLETTKFKIQYAVASIESFNTMHVNEIWNNTPSHWFQFGTASFKQMAGVNAAMEKLSFQHGGFHVKAETQMKPTIDKSSVSSVTVTWSRRSSVGYGFIKCESDQHVYTCIQCLRGTNSSVLGSAYSSLVGPLCKFSVNNKDPKSIHVSRIDKDATSGDLKSYVRNSIADNDTLTAEEKRFIVDNTCVIYSKDLQLTDLAKETSAFTARLIATLNNIDVKSVFVFPIQKETQIHCKAKLSFDSFEQAERAVNHLNSGAFRIGTQKCHAAIQMITRFYCKNDVMDCISNAVNSLSKIAKDYMAKVEVSDNKSKTSKIITLSGEDTFMYNEFKGRLKEIVEGQVIDDIKVSRACYEVMKEHIRRLEKDLLDTKIDYDSRTERFHVFGRPELKAFLAESLRKIYTDLSLNSTIEVSLRGSGRSPGLLKKLIIKYGPDMQMALKNKDAGTIQVNLRRHMVHISGSEQLQLHIKSLIDKCDAELKQAKGGTSDIAYEDYEECSLCFCELDEKMYRLQTCGHVYCVSCLDQFLESAARDKVFPVTCCKQECEKKLVIKDFDIIIGDASDAKQRKDNMTKAAISALVTSEPNKFRYCPTADCSMIYRVTQEFKAFLCPLCRKNMCSACHEDMHTGFSCEQWATRNDDRHVLQWAESTDAKRCKKCNTLIEKNGGCMHVSCRCGAHICWRCTKIFDSPTECCNHLGNCGGIF